MTQTLTRAGFTPAEFDAFVAARGEPTWLADARRAAWARFQALSWPARNAEEWLRTDIRGFRLEDYHLAAGELSPAELPEGELAAGLSLAGEVATLDSRVVRHSLAAKWASKGVLFGSWEQILAEHAETIRPHAMRGIVDPLYDKFSSLHSAWFHGGAVVYIPRGVTLDEPLYVLSAVRDGGVDLGRILVVLEAGAEATVVCETRSADPAAAGLHCGSIELAVGEGARLRYVNLQNWGNKVWHFAHQRAVVGRDGSLQWTIGALGARLAKVNQRVALAGPGAEAQVNGVMFTEGKQHLSYHTLQEHEAPSCRSDLLYKTALQDKSRTVWRGMIRVDKGAQKTDAYQRNDNLMLSHDARADSIPGLEIEADDVRCTHGSTSGRVDEEQIFYCGSRGLTRPEAVRMIVTGFFQQVFDRITIESVREALGHAIRRRIREYE